MKTVKYVQVWGMEQWLQDQEDLVGKAFSSLTQIAWLESQGYKGQISRSYNMQSDNFHVTMSFEVPDRIYTFLVLKWSEEVSRVDFDGPTLREERSTDA